MELGDAVTLKRDRTVIAFVFHFDDHYCRIIGRNTNLIVARNEIELLGYTIQDYINEEMADCDFRAI